ncbi:GAF domain-containing protein [Bacillus horti]|uniref:Methionine-R-sulfoxide reductase with GAF domain n=1 Tax=Caldalkalibacillus horti TaxID=77523 RepID=A0ABT9W129_9BACI|nr:GAF domain-containing protein [Bacillus horti]MDQ0166959.1 putative methionine-R-sulfoxide reductase with GAF domain [Bacillus horti]
MSIKTDIASLEILAQVYQTTDMKETLQCLVRTLHEQVSYFDWVGLYLNKGEQMVLEAASCTKDTLAWESNAELRIPIHKQEQEDMELGKLVVRSKQPICFDVTDLSTLKKLTSELGSKLFTH